MLVSLKDITNCEDYYIDDENFQIVSFKQKKYEQGRILKPDNRNGYIYYDFYVNGKRKHIYLHHILVKMFINPDFDSTKNNIDHLNHNRQDNSIDNLSIVSRSENQRNKSSYKGKEFIFLSDIGKTIVINAEAGIYYSLDLDKFYMKIAQSGKFKELHEHFNNGKNPSIRYRYNNKQHMFSIDKFKKSIKQQ